MPEEGFVIIDKSPDWTSHDVVAKMRGILGIRKIGHLGTLDPLATGVLVLAVGRSATKKVQDYMKLEKIYEVEMELGRVSDTYDLAGKVESTGFDLSTLDEKMIESVVVSFWGKSMQVPPAFSAKKVNGRRAYQLARKGQEVTLSEVPVEMQGKDLQIDTSSVKFKVKVSSGTYVRSLVHDIGVKLGSGAVLTNLRRLSVGDFKIEDALTIDEILNGAKIRFW